MFIHSSPTTLQPRNIRLRSPTLKTVSNISDMGYSRVVDQTLILDCHIRHPLLHGDMKTSPLVIDLLYSKVLVASIEMIISCYSK